MKLVSSQSAIRQSSLNMTPAPRSRIAACNVQRGLAQLNIPRSQALPQCASSIILRSPSGTAPVLLANMSASPVASRKDPMSSLLERRSECAVTLTASRTVSPVPRSMVCRVRVTKYGPQAAATRPSATPRPMTVVAPVTTEALPSSQSPVCVPPTPQSLKYSDVNPLLLQSCVRSQ